MAPLIYIRQEAYDTLRAVVEQKNAALFERAKYTGRRVRRASMSSVVSDAIMVLDEPSEPTDNIMEGR